MRRARLDVKGWNVQEASSRPLVGRKKRFHFTPQLGVAVTRAIEEGTPFRGIEWDHFVEIQRNNIHAGLHWKVEGIIQRQPAGAAVALGGASSPGVLDQDLPHDVAAIPKKCARFC